MKFHLNRATSRAIEPQRSRRTLRRTAAVFINMVLAFGFLTTEASAATGPWSICLKLSGQPKTVCRIFDLCSRSNAGLVYINAHRIPHMTTSLAAVRGSKVLCRWNLPNDSRSHQFGCKVGRGYFDVVSMGDSTNLSATVAYPV